ncbi:hypothetical protein [Streptomyces bicolor]|uniref:hypothetical protein n=1 Tax=Streptomyces bicolor TaxID=66874 RepID=UPI0004E2572B|nr:hypothetical protein [Streptomyces bicolor]
MSRSLRKSVASIVGVAGIAAAYLALGAGPASAVPHCNSPVFTGCVWIDNHTHGVHSWRLNVTQPNGRTWNRCLIGSRPGGHTSTYSQVWFSGRDKVSVTAYTAKNCEGWSKSGAWHGYWVGPSQDQWWVLKAYSG